MSVLRRGHVKSVQLDRQFGFIRFGGGIEAFFGPGDLDSLTFDETLQGREVLAFLTQRDDGKYRARGVRPAWK